MGLPALSRKDAYEVGFAQAANDTPWRVAQTASMRDEAARVGCRLVCTDARGSAARQVSDVNAMVVRGVDLIFLSPVEGEAIVPAVTAAKAAGVPVVLLDRGLEPSPAAAGEDYLTFMGSDFVGQGRRLAEWLVRNANGKTKIIEIEGAEGAAPAVGRKQGFDEAVTAAGGFKILASRSGDCVRDKGRQVAETLLGTHPDANVVYAHHEEMAHGAVAALDAAGRTPGKDVIVLSVGGGREILQAVADGRVNAVVECNPRFGPLAFETLHRCANGERIGPWVKQADGFFDMSNVAAGISRAY
ncbi:ABC transporter substrate-binding protein [Streptomyces sp. NPDC056257]|uniref:ABC transporter substrate-binding protein n=1 Tax=Streptomyces sp. NPDC056257 TaxID=3345765 RepID=UPI0035D82859